jgi:hypothetical protein
LLLQALLLLLLCGAARGSQQARHTDAAVKGGQSGIIVNLFQQVQNNTRKARRVGQKHMDKEIEILVDLMEKAKNYTMREDLMEKAKNYSIIAVGDLTNSEGHGNVLKVVNNIMEEILREDQIRPKPVEKERKKRMRQVPKNQNDKVPNLFNGLKQRRRVLKKRPVTAKGQYWKQRLARNPKNILTDAIYRYDVRRTTPPTTRYAACSPGHGFTFVQEGPGRAVQADGGAADRGPAHRLGRL